MFPAPAGMSPNARRRRLQHHNVPRTRGDEPGNLDVDKDFSQCSPHPRG